MPRTTSDTITYEYLRELERFNSSNHEHNDILEQYLIYVANTGNILFPWDLVKNVIYHKTLASIELMYLYDVNNSIDTDSYESMKICVLSLLQKFDECPFTIQRIAELIINPYENYKTVLKYLRGLEKNLLVVSSIPDNQIVNCKDVNCNEDEIISKNDSNIIISAETDKTIEMNTDAQASHQNVNDQNNYEDIESISAKRLKVDE